MCDYWFCIVLKAFLISAGVGGVIGLDDFDDSDFSAFSISSGVAAGAGLIDSRAFSTSVSLFWGGGVAISIVVGRDIHQIPAMSTMIEATRSQMSLRWVCFGSLSPGSI